MKWSKSAFMYNVSNQDDGDRTPAENNVSHLLQAIQGLTLTNLLTLRAKTHYSTLVAKISPKYCKWLDE